MKEWYVIERWTGIWTPEGLEYDNYNEAEQELVFNRKLYPQEKWRLVKKMTTVIWKKT